MKMNAAAAAKFCARPDRSLLGALLYGPDDALTAHRRRDLVAALSEGDEMRVSRLDAGGLKQDPAALDEALRARGFFPGRRVVLLDNAKDTAAPVVKAALDGLNAEDAFLVIEAGDLTGKSPLRKLFEGDRRLAACGLYPQAPDRTAVREALAAAGLRHGIEDDAADLLVGHAADADAGSFGQLLTMIATHGLDRTEPLGVAELAAVMPQTTDTALDALVNAVAEGKEGEVGALYQRVTASGSSATRVLIVAGGYFRDLLTVAVAPDGPDRALFRLRPPARGQRGDRIVRQARRWGAPKLERAVRLLFETDRTLRSPGTRPDAAMVERALIRLAMMAR